MLKQSQIDKIMKEYTKGTKVILLNMEGESQMPRGLKGEVDHVDDAGQIHVRWENGSSLALNVEVDTFHKVESEKKISVVLVEPNKYPEVVEIEDTLEAMQKIVGGCIEQYMPFDDEVAIICNDEGKLNGLPLNRAICTENKKILDIIAGTFFIVYAPFESEKFLSMPNELAKKYKEKFKYPERFSVTDDGIKAEPYTPTEEKP